MVAIGVDVGGTKCLAVALNNEGSVLDSLTLPTAMGVGVVEEVAEEEFVDIEEIKQLPTVSNKATETNLADAFPGSEILAEDD